MFKNKMILDDVLAAAGGQPRFYFADPSSGGGAASPGAGGQGASGNLPPDIDPALSDVKLDALAKLPEEERKEVLGALATKIKNLQAIGTKKSEEYAAKLEELQSKLEDVKLVENIRSNPDLAKAIEKTINDFKRGAITNKSDTDDVFEKWISNASTTEERENLIKLRERIEAGSKTALEEVKLLKQELAAIKQATQAIHSDRAASGISMLKAKFGKDIIAKYEAKLSAAVGRNQQRPGEAFDTYMESLFLNVATPEDYRAAFRNEIKLTEERDTRIRKEGLEPSGTGASGKDVDIPRDKKTGKIDIKGLSKNLADFVRLNK